jgi:hypothetical protein
LLFLLGQDCERFGYVGAVKAVKAVKPNGGGERDYDYEEDYRGEDYLGAELV